MFFQCHLLPCFLISLREVIVYGVMIGGAALEHNDTRYFYPILGNNRLIRRFSCADSVHVLPRGRLVHGQQRLQGPVFLLPVRHARPRPAGLPQVQRQRPSGLPALRLLRSDSLLHQAYHLMVC